MNRWGVVLAVLAAPLAVAGVSLVLASALRQPVAIVAPTMRLHDDTALDQDDLCIWIHPKDADKSTVIASDKKTGCIYVYALDGKTLQTVLLPHPGNVDIRYSVVFRTNPVDVVVVNFDQAEDPRLAVFVVNPSTRKLERYDDEAIRTGKSYGGGLYHSRTTGKLHAFVTSRNGDVEQYVLRLEGDRITADQVRAWKLERTCEGLVADDEAGVIFVAEEEHGIWRLNAEVVEGSDALEDTPPGILTMKVRELGLRGDIEGLAIYRRPGGEGYLLVSDQGPSQFRVHDLKPPHRLRGLFCVSGAEDTDGIDVTSAPLGKPFPRGVFICHTDREDSPLLLVPWERIANRLELVIDPGWNPRAP